MNSVKHYIQVTAGLLGLLLLAVGAAYVHFGPLNTAVALLISAAKAALIILFFMGARGAKPLTRVFIGAGFFWLALLITLTLGDYLSR